MTDPDFWSHFQALGSRTLARGGVVVDVTVRHDGPAACPRCKGGIVGNGFSVMTLADLPHDGRPGRLRIKVRRWRCRNCGHTVAQKVPCKEPGVRATSRLCDAIRRMSGAAAWSTVARELGINERTVRRIAERALGGDDGLER